MHIAIVIPAWNVAPWIGETLASVLAQSHGDWSATVVDDGSTDGTADVVARISNRRIRLVRQANAGVAAARNRGSAEARGDALLFLDADDFLASDALVRLDATLASATDAVAACAGFAFVDADATMGAASHACRAVPLPPHGLFPTLLERNPFANGGHLLIRRDAVARAGGFRPGLAYGEDWEYWVRLALLGPFAPVPGRAPALFVRQRANGAYLSMATDPAALRPCMDAIFGNRLLIAQFGSARLATIRCRTEAENQWVIGRELVRHGRLADGRAWLRRSVIAKPSLKRAALLVAAQAITLLPSPARGPFRPYAKL